MVTGLDAATLRRIQPVGAISRYPVADDDSEPDPRTVTVLLGSGGDSLTTSWLQQARAGSPGWSWTVLGRRSAAWVADPWPAIRAAAVVVTAAGQNTLAETMSARRPALVVPQHRPHREQIVTAVALTPSGCPVEVIEPGSRQDWATLLDRVSRLDGQCWASWCDGRAAGRAARIIERTRHRQLTGARVG